MKTTDQTTEYAVGELIPQPHGGALRNGGTNAGGPGRPPNEARIRSLEGYTKFLTRCEQIALESENEANALRAGEVMGKFGLGEPTKLSNAEFASVVAECAVPFFADREEDYKAFVESISRRLGQ